MISGPVWPAFACSAGDGTLRFGDQVAGHYGRTVGAQRRTLERFRQLHSCPTDAGIVRFAERYGRLGLRGDGLPDPDHATAHRPGTETVSAWRYWSRQADAILTLADAVKSPPDTAHGIASAEAAAKGLFERPPWESGDTWDDYRAMWLETPHSDARQPDGAGRVPVQPRGGRRPAVTQRGGWPGLVASALNQWTRCANARPIIARPALYSRVRGFSLDVEYGSLFGLVGQLLVAEVVTDGERRPSTTATCANPACGRQFERWQQYGRARYCQQCHGDGTPERLASAAYRARRVTGDPVAKASAPRR